MKRVLSLVLCVSWLATQGQQPTSDYAKEWQFPLQRGQARARLYRAPEERLVLSLKGPSCYQCASNAELAGMLGEVMRQMPALGFKPERLSMIEMHVEDPAVSLALANAAARSPAWTRCSTSPGCGGNELVVKFLNEIAAFGALENVLKGYGLTAQVGSAENIAAVRADKIRGLTLPTGARKTMKVPEDADLEIRVRSIR